MSDPPPHPRLKERRTPTDDYKVRIEGDQLIVYGHAARQNIQALANALYAAAQDVEDLLGAMSAEGKPAERGKGRAE